MSTIYERVRKCSYLFERWQEVAIAASSSVRGGESVYPEILPSKINIPRSTEAAVQEDRYRAPTDTAILVKLENDLFRFTLWTNHFSALSRRKDSLDWRLRKSEVTFSVVLDLLDDLAHALSVQIGLQAASKDDSIDDPEVVLDQLVRYSKAIRSSGALRRLAKASGYIEYDENTNINLSAKYREGVDWLLQHKFGDNPLRNRLLETICIRQQSFAFEKSRRENKRTSMEGIAHAKFERPRGSPVSVFSHSVRSSVTATSQPTSKTPQLAAQNRRIGAPPSDATTFQSHMSQAPEYEPELEQSDTVFPLDELPVRPKIGPGEKEHECPYCFMLCPKDDFTDSGWPKHIVKDLMPFICVLDDCVTPNILYDSKVLWIRHMTVEHAHIGWTCMNVAHDVPVEFTSKQDFVDHLRDCYGNNITHEEIEEAKEECYGKLQGGKALQCCPFCHWTEPATDPGITLMDHVASHLLRMSHISISGYDATNNTNYETVSSGSESSASGASGSYIPSSRATTLGHTTLYLNEDVVKSQQRRIDASSDDMRLLTADTVSFFDWESLLKRKMNGKMYNDQEYDPVLESFITARSSQNDTSKVPIPELLLNASVISYYQLRFIPERQIWNIVRDDVIQAELHRSNRPVGKPWRILKAPIVTEAYGSYKRVMTILFLMKRPSKIRLFVKSGLRDDHLPFKKTQLPGVANRSVALTSRNVPRAPSMEFAKPEDADEFLDRQWLVLAPMFSQSDGIIRHYDFEQETILPFLPETTIAKKGGSSKVIKAKIHPDHHNLSQAKGGSNIFAVKILKSKDEGAFTREATVLRRLSTREHTHAHLITLLATYKQGATYHLIFPWADADLFDYWKRSQEAPPEHDQTGAWVIEQCRGLAEGLSRIHRYPTFFGEEIFDAFQLSSRSETDRRHQSTHIDVVNLFGRHGDLKPENILWYPDFQTTGGHGVLKITDFGVTRFNTENMWDTQKTGKLPNSPTYRSPESDLDGKLTTACDVWALGCIYLEFVAWYFGGYRLVQSFSKQRLAPDPLMADILSDTFFTIVEREGEKTVDVKPAVLKMIESLQEHHRCTGDYSDFLDTIKDDMLVTHSPEAPGSVDGSLILQNSVSEPVGTPRLGYIRRKSCRNVVRKLGDIAEDSSSEAI